jgi:hypothetical protein
MKGKAPNGVRLVDFSQSTDDANPIAQKAVKEKSGVVAFREELRDLGSRTPTILVFGSAAHALIAENISRHEYLSLIRLTHYSHQIGKKKCRETVLAQIRSHTVEGGSGLLASLTNG